MRFEEACENIRSILSVSLPKQLTYHSVGHIEDVFQAAQNIGHAEGITEYELQLLLTAVLFHDSGFLVSLKEHELHSCELARKHLPDYDYTAEEIERICEMIMATRLPQMPASHLGKILCDADLDYLGRDDFFRIGDLLFQELIYQGVLETEFEWNSLQVRFLEKHEYFSNTAIRLRASGKLRNLELVRAKLL